MPLQSAMPPAGAASVTRLVWDVSELGESLLTVLFPHLAGLRLYRVEDTGDAVVISASSRAGQACCPGCGTPSSRVHGGYARTVADGAVGGRPLLISLAVRRFRCLQGQCPAVTFAEQASGLTERYRRRSVPVLGMLAGFGLELAGRAGARLAGTLGIAVHPSTVLRLVMALPEPQVTTGPEILGVDDFALRKGHVYGTVLVDIGAGAAVDLLPDREAATLESWLKAHPGAQVICRDRAGAYAEGARDGAPDAIQVADRWHLWHNLAESAEKTVTRHRGCLKDQPAGDDDAGPDDPGTAGVPQPETKRQEDAAQAAPDGSLDACGRERRLVTRTRERYAEIRRRLDDGQSLAGICRALDLDRKTVQRFARAASVDELLVNAMNRESKLDRFKPYLCQRWNEGITDAAALHAELQQRGWAGSVKTVRRYVAPFRQLAAAPAPGPAVPKTRQITRWLLTRPDRLREEEQEQLGQITERCPHIQALSGHVSSFAEMMTGRTGSRDLESWLTAIEADDSQPDLRSLAAGIRNDQQAVTNGLSLPYSSGKVEGTVNKIKMIKRQMYGRAGFVLLRKRVILHPALPDHKIRGRAIIGDHTVSHPNLTKVSLSQATAQWKQDRTDLGHWLGQTPAIGRPPYGAFNSTTEVAAARGGLTALAGWS
ncbi:MAG: ISL3 family transposase, partial [Streptosporangiaceae bacterium]